jgi:hypothetical protein
MSNESTLSDKATALADEVAAGIRDGGYAPESFDALCSEIETDEPPASFELFAVSVDDVAQWRFNDSELCEHFDIDKQQTTEQLKLQYMRELLIAAIESPNENTSSAHWEEITLTSNAPLFCCALVHIERYEPITCWYGAYLSLDDFYIDLRLADFVLREPDVVSLSDERLLTYWTDGF